MIKFDLSPRKEKKAAMKKAPEILIDGINLSTPKDK